MSQYNVSGDMERIQQELDGMDQPSAERPLEEHFDWHCAIPYMRALLEQRTKERDQLRAELDAMKAPKKRGRKAKAEAEVTDAKQ